MCLCVCCDEEDAPLCSLTSFVPLASESESERKREGASMKRRRERRKRRMSVVRLVKLFKKQEACQLKEREGAQDTRNVRPSSLTSHLLIPLAVRVFCAMASLSLRRLRAESRRVLPKVT